MHPTLLYIDPHPTTRLLVLKALGSEAFAVRQALTARDGQQAAADLRPDLVLVDVDRVRAAELVPALRRSPGLEHVKLLASTTDARPEHLEKMLAWGFDRVWLQPLDIDTLAVDLTEILPVVAPLAELSPADPAPREEARERPAVDDTAPIAAASEEERAAAPPLSPAEASAGATATTLPADVGPVVTLAPVEVPLLWRLGLTPLLAQLVRSTAAADGLLALLHDEALVVVAAFGSRHADNGRSTAGAPPVGARVVARSAPWIHSTLHAREVVIAAADGIEPNTLVPAGSQALLLLPVASGDRVRGVAVLGKHRAAKGPAFAPNKVARGVGLAQQLAGLVEMLEALDSAADQKRRELERARLDAVRAVLAEVIALARPARRGHAEAEPKPWANGHDPAGDAVVRLGLSVADRLGLSPAERRALAQALEVRDVGRAWVEQVLLARTTLSVAWRERLLDGAAEHGAQILASLEWPSVVVELVRAQLAPEAGDADAPGADVPLEARAMAVVSAYGALVAGRVDEPATDDVIEALARLSRDGAGRPATEMLEALMGIALAQGDARAEAG